MSFQKFKLTVFKLAQRANIVHLTPSVNALQNLWEREYSPLDVIEEMQISENNRAKRETNG